MGGGQSRRPPPPEDEPPRRQVPASTAGKLTRRYSRKFSNIADQFETLDQVQESLRHAGLESSNLILGIDFTKSNEWTGKHSFGGHSLHAIGDIPNPYESAISIIGRTLSRFDEDNLIPCFGFGDASTHDQYVFSFNPDQRPCQGFEEALERYRHITPRLRLAGPTSFAPIIEAAMGIVEESTGQYHVLVIIADGQVTRSVDTDVGRLSPQEQATIDAIVAASDYPLSIILVGVGDGPWDMMREFDDNIPARAFDNFQFVNFSEVMSRNRAVAQKEASFALAALMEIPQQYKATMELGLLGRQTRQSHKAPLPPPPSVIQANSQMHRGYAQPGGYTQSGFPHSDSFSRGMPTYAPDIPSYPPVDRPYSKYHEYNLPPHLQHPPAPVVYGYPPQQSRSERHYAEPPKENNNDQFCPVCLTETKDMAFGCGHQTCRACGKDLQNCPICRERIATRIRLY